MYGLELNIAACPSQRSNKRRLDPVLSHEASQRMEILLINTIKNRKIEKQKGKKAIYPR
jgi:hypothetical protein